MSKDMIDALLLEREGYLRYGRADRAAQVDEQLSLLGYKSKPTPPVERAVAPTTEKRTTRKRTAK